MNTSLGLIGKKVGNTQVFTDDGEIRRVTVVEAGPCTVVGKRTVAKHGYSAIQLGFGVKKTTTRPVAGQFSHVEAGVPEVVREFRLPAEKVDGYEVGQQLKASEIFEEGGFVDVCATSKGRGFTGVMKRHNFAGYKATHGAHEYQRHGGSIGMNMTPGRVFKGKKMAGQHGNKRVTVMSLKVVKVMDEEGIVMVKGSVPGPRGGVVTIRQAAKKAKKANA